MSEPSYTTARAVAARVEAHFREHLSRARELGLEEVAPQPDAAAVETIVDAAFWASLRREEGREPKISLAFVAPEQTGRPMRLERTIPLGAAALAHLAPAVERPGIHLGVWRVGDELHVWGTTRLIPAYCFVLEVVQPGVLVVKHRREEEFGKYVNVMVLHGDEVKEVDEDATRLPDCPALVASLLDFARPLSGDPYANVLVQLAVSMRAHGRGGTLLVVPSGNERWRDSIVRPISYAVVPPFDGLARVVAADEEERGRPEWQEAFRRAIDGVAGLTAVDGATVINDRYELLAFGVKIGHLEGSPSVEEVVLTEPVAGAEPVAAHPAAIGGTRHLSAAQFVHDQRDALALVASQDGRFTVFAWSPCERRAHAHRVEALLM